ncbi:MULTISPECIES: flavin reductase family protein [Streptomyces violaceusniger group]|uniref:Flavin reductase like domain-containing protein n=1 Tax=Streptomyces rhizosphaericus TaxID=114699 RepID=A0ABP4D2X9_9ACTN|nr:MULTISPECIES: flavin reductase family protein [Streptomyces violaceusniger group]
MAVIDRQQFRDVMSGVCTPVTIVTSAADGVPFGTTVSSFASLSLDPPLISLALDRGSSLLAQIQTARRFAVNILGQAARTARW